MKCYPTTVKDIYPLYIYIKDKYKLDHGGTKLTPNSMNKKNYVVHYRNLSHYTDLGLNVTKG